MHLRRTRLACTTAVSVGLLLAPAPAPAHASPGPAEQHVAARHQPSTVVVRLRTAVADLRVRRRSHAASYDRAADFGNWVEQGGGCDTRAVVLKDESLRPTTQTSGCTVETGRWYSFYNGVTYTDAYGGIVQIDHVVPVENVWVSGGWHWTQATRVAYYNDLGDPRTLVAVDAHDNESKGDRSPDAWMPPVGHCQYVRYYVAAKVRWNLTVSRPEKRAIAGYASHCRNTTLRVTRATIRTR